MAGIRGESVGTAYVHILADGSGLPQSIRDEFKDAKGEFEQAGESDSERYSKGFEKQLKKDKGKIREQQEKNLTIAAGRMDAIAKQVTGDYFKSLKKSLRSRFTGETGDTEIADRIFKSLVGDFEKTGSFKAINDKLKNIQVLARQATAEIMADEARHDAVRKRQLAERERDLNRSLTQMVAAEKRASSASAGLDADRARRKRAQNAQELRDFDKLFKDMGKAVSDNDKALRAAETDRMSRLRNLSILTDKLTKGEKASNAERNHTLKLIRELNVEFSKTLRVGDGDKSEVGDTLHNLETRLRTLNPGLSNFNNRLDGVSVNVGRTFGRGSRNNFLNFFGGMLEGTTRLAFALPKLAEKVTAFGSGFANAASGTSRLGSAFSALGATGASAGASLAAVGVAAAVLIVVLPIIVSAALLLGGVLIALASTISFAVIGALGALAGLVLPLVAGFGALGIAIASMDDKTKAALQRGLRPLIAEFKSLGKVAAGEIFRDAGAQAARLAPIFRGLEPLVRGVSRAVRDVGVGFIDALEGPGFKNFRKAMEGFLPDAIRSLGKIAAQTFGGIGGLLVGMIPITQRFLAWLEKLTARFSDWANSAKGKSEIENFFERAGDSARSLGDFLREVGGLIKEVLTAGQGTGDSIFDKMAVSIKSMTDHLKENPEALSDFFKDVGDFADGLGTVVITIGKIIDAMDSPASRAGAEALLKIVSITSLPIIALFTSVNAIMTASQALMGGIASGLGALGGAIGGGVSAAFSFLGGILSGIGTAIGGLVTGGFTLFMSTLSAIGGFISGVFNAALTTLQGLLTGVANILGPILSPILSIVTSLVSILGSALSASLSVGLLAVGTAAALVGAVFSATVVPAFNALQSAGGALASFLGGALSGAFGALRGIASTVAGALRGPVVAAFSALRSVASTLAGLLRGALSGGFSAVRSVANTVASLFRGALNGAFSAFRGVVDAVGRALSPIAGFLRGIASAARTAASALAKIKVPNISIGNPFNNATGAIMDGIGGRIRAKNMASGGFANFAQEYRIGESGPEAIVPLMRPLSQVDPAVRRLSAFAQGLPYGDTTNNNGKTVDASGWTVVSNSEDARTVATEIVNTLTATGF